jgi:hypothetical protein
VAITPAQLKGQPKVYVVYLLLVNRNANSGAHWPRPDYAKLCTLPTNCLQRFKAKREIAESSDDLVAPKHRLDHARELHHSQ